MEDEKLELLSLLLEEQGIEAETSSRAIRRVSDRTKRALSFAQERLWFLDQLGPGSAVYNVPAAYRLRGPVEPSCVERAINEIIRRHETLRTRFATVEGHPAPVVGEFQPRKLDFIDITNPGSD